MKHKASDVVVPSGPEYDAFVTRMSRVFIAAAFFVMMSQNLLAPNLTAAAASFGLSAQERDTIMGGWMSTAFFLVGGPCSLVRGGQAGAPFRGMGMDAARRRGPCFGR
jgi:hypothetical protein